MTRTSRSMLIAAFSAAAVSAGFVGGKATRDALFLTALDITALPAMLVATSLCSILLAAVYARGWWALSRRMPHRFGVGRLAAFLGGLTVIAVSLESSLDALAGERLSAHITNRRRNTSRVRSTTSREPRHGMDAAT